MSELFSLSSDSDFSGSIYWTVFSRIHSPSCLFFAPECDLSHQLQLCNFCYRHRAVYISIFAIVIAYFTRLTSFSSFSLKGQFFYPPDYLHCLPWGRLCLSWRVGPVARRSWTAQISTSQRRDRLLLAFCSLYACLTFSIWCLPTSQHWHFFLMFICCPWSAIKLYLKTAECERRADCHKE